MKLLHNRCSAASATFALCALLFVLCDSVHAQQKDKVLRIGFLDSSTASGSALLLEAFRQELSKFGWTVGKNITIEYRFAENKNDRLPEFAADLVRQKIDLIVVSGGPAALAAKRATTTIPIVMVNLSDPVGQGLVAGLARPEGNVTGLSFLAGELGTKRLEVLKDALPKLARVGVLWPTGFSASAPQLKELRPAAVRGSRPRPASSTRPQFPHDHRRALSCEAKRDQLRALQEAHGSS